MASEAKRGQVRREKRQVEQKKKYFTQGKH